MADTKVCSSCGEPKPLDDFNRDTRTHDGLQSWCKPCKAEAKREARRRRDEERSDELMKAEEGFDGFAIKGMSTLYGLDEEGNRVPKVQWVKTQKDHAVQIEEMAKHLEVLCEPYRGIVEPTAAPDGNTDDLMCVIPMGDPHVGMYAWAEEAGEDFDLETCTRNIRSAIERVVQQAPDSKRCALVLLGDNFHADSPANRTEASGHALDVDTRWSKVLREGIRTFRWCIDRLAQKHQEVEVVVARGNHDSNSALMLAIALELAYENEPRVTIHRNESKFAYLRFGANLIGVHHGDTVRKLGELPAIMAADRPTDWGETKHRRWLVGHVHHESAREYRGCVVETFRILAPGDAWHNGAGYRADRDIRCDVLHRDHGMIGRTIIGIDQITGGTDG